MPLPPAFAAGALYDGLLQSALARFFARAVLETALEPSTSSQGKLSMEPTDDPAAMVLRWFGTRHVLRVPSSAPFTPHEIRLARAIGDVLQARYRAIFEPRLMAARGDLFQGMIEDRYIGAFLDGTYTIDEQATRADRIASAIEVLRVAALSSYENKPISSGVLILDSAGDPCRHGASVAHARYSQALTAVKAFHRLCDGLRTVFLMNRDGDLLDVVDLARWAAELTGPLPLTTPVVEGFRAHAMATNGNRHVCVVLSPRHEIKVFADGAQIFTFRHARWHLLDIAAKYERWRVTVGEARLAERLFQAALDLADARQGALFVVVRDPAAALPHLVDPADLFGGAPAADSSAGAGVLSRQDLYYLMWPRNVLTLDATVLEALATIDGAPLVAPDGRLLTAGAILRHPPAPAGARPGAEGARTTAAVAASRFGPVLKVSEDGLISCYDGAQRWDL